jgi:hypothetical protein
MDLTVIIAQRNEPELKRTIEAVFAACVDDHPQVLVVNDGEQKREKGRLRKGLLLRQENTSLATSDHNPTDLLLSISGIKNIDDKLVMNGSFNWTVAAVKNNNENIVVTSDATMISSFKKVKWSNSRNS